MDPEMKFGKCAVPGCGVEATTFTSIVISDQVPRILPQDPLYEVFFDKLCKFSPVCQKHLDETNEWFGKKLKELQENPPPGSPWEDTNNEINCVMPDAESTAKIVVWLVRHRNIWEATASWKPDAPGKIPDKLHEMGENLRIMEKCNEGLKAEGLIPKHQYWMGIRLGFVIRMACEIIGTEN